MNKLTIIFIMILLTGCAQVAVKAYLIITLTWVKPNQNYRLHSKNRGLKYCR